MFASETSRVAFEINFSQAVAAAGPSGLWLFGAWSGRGDLCPSRLTLHILTFHSGSFDLCLL